MKRIIPIITISFLLTALFSLTSCIFKIEPPENGLPKDPPNEGLEIKTVTDENGRSCLAVVGIGSCKDTKIVIPSERNGFPIEEISSRAFYESEGIVEVTVPDSVKRIGLFAFSGSKDLEKVTLPVGLTEIPDGTFEYCPKLSSVNIPQGVTKIGADAFSLCSSLANVQIPESVTNLGDSVFALCHNLTELQIPGSVTAIGDMAFIGCGRQFTIHAPAGSYAEQYAKENTIPFTVK